MSDTAKIHGMVITKMVQKCYPQRGSTRVAKHPNHPTTGMPYPNTGLEQRET